MPNSVVLDGIRITLVPGYPTCVDNVQTWRYSVEFVAGPPTPGVSNFAFQLCNPQHIVTSFSPLEGGEFDLNNAQPCLANIGATRQMKWNRNNDNAVGIYEFSLQGCFIPGEINVALHAGNNCTFGTITGPTCQLIPPQPPEILMVKSATPTTACVNQSQTYTVVITITNTGTQAITGTLTDTTLAPFSNVQTHNFGVVTVNPGPNSFSYTVTGLYPNAGAFQFNTATFVYITPNGPITVTANGPDIVVTECRGLQFS